MVSDRMESYWRQKSQRPNLYRPQYDQYQLLGAVLLYKPQLLVKHHSHHSNKNL